MQTLHKFVQTKIFKSAILPIVFVEILVLAGVFLLNYSSGVRNEELVMQRAQKEFQILANQIGTQVSVKFNTVIDDTTSLKQLIELNYKMPNLNKTLEFKYADGFFILKNDFGSSVYTTNISTLNTVDKTNLTSLYEMSAPMLAILKKHKSTVSYTWINIGKKYSLFYPKIVVADELSPDLDVTTQPYYYKADAENNPNRETVFIPLFNEPWAIDVGQIGAVASPIYKDEKMIGVVGMALTSQSTKYLEEIDLPYNSYFLITGMKGKLLYSSDEKQSYSDFKVNSFIGLVAQHRNEALKKFECDTSINSNYIFHEHEISNTGLKLILVAKKSEVGKGVRTIFEQTRFLGMAFLLFLLMLHFYLYKKLKRRAQKVTQEISLPISEIADASSRLFHEDELSFAKSSINEFSLLHSNMKKAHEKLIDQLYMDALTSLPNQRKLLLDIKDENLLLISVDNLKNIYNLYGSDIADEVLLSFVKSLGELYENQRIYRVYSNTFAILGDIDNLLEAHYTKVKSIKIVKDSISMVLDFSLSFASAEKQSELSLFSRAEIALDEARLQEHLNCVEFNEKKHLKAYKENIKWAKKLQDAFDENRLVAYFQPIYNIKENRVYKFESLVRMIDGDKVISPFFFLGAAARMGKLSDITRIMLRQVFETSLKYPDVEFSINVSFEDFEQADLLPEIKSLIESYEINASNIIFELLETGTLGDENKIIETIRELKALGCKIAIDDFGTGNSNFAHLMLMKVDYIKIDGQFIKNIHEDQQSLNITKTIKAFADMTGAQTIAEFVSEKEIFEVVRGLEIDFAQGYYLSEPLPASLIEKMLKIGKTSTL